MKKRVLKEENDLKSYWYKDQKRFTPLQLMASPHSTRREADLLKINYLPKQKRVTIRRPKLIVLGQPSSGKSSTISNLLIHKNEDPKVQRFSTRKNRKWLFPGTSFRDQPTEVNVWEYPSSKAGTAMTHVCFSEFACYLLVLNLKNMVDEKKRERELENINLWLFAKKLRARESPILLIGTHADVLSEEEMKEVNQCLVQRVFKNNVFSEVNNGKLVFFPLNNLNGDGVAALFPKLRDQIMKQKNLEDKIPVSFHKLLLKLEAKKETEDFVNLWDLAEDFEDCGMDFDSGQKALIYLASRGVIVFFSQHDLLRKYVILNPHWLIDVFGAIIDLENTDDLKETEEKLARDIRKLENDNVYSRALIYAIWGKMGIDDAMCKFFLRVMQRLALGCSYSFDAGDYFTIPLSVSKGVLFDVEETKTEFTGPHFVIDFSGDYDSEVSRDDGDLFVRFMPFGFFEALVCLCIDVSTARNTSRKATISNQAAELSFGVDVDFKLEIVQNEEGKAVWIKVSTDEDTTMESARDLVRSIFSMVESVTSDFFFDYSEKSKLSVTLLLPSSKETNSVLANYQLLLDLQKKAETDIKKSERKLRPNNQNRKKIPLSAYAHWFDEGTSVKGDALLTDTSLYRSVRSPKSRGLRGTPGAAFKVLPVGLDYHCFLSYKQSSAIDIVGKQYYILTNKGYKCWYDQQFRGEINLKNMREGVMKSMCYILVLSKDVFPSKYVEEEVKTALEFKKPIIFLHHPDTGNVGYSRFADYINKAPDVVKPLFSEIESIQLQRRHYLEEAVTRLLDGKLNDILQEAKRA